MRARKITSLGLLLGGLLLAGGCARKAADPKPEVEAAIRDYLKGRPGLALDKMEVEVQEVTLQGDRAEAQVRFRTQSGEGEMTLRYQLRREGERWVVELGSVHGGTGAMPPGHPSPGSRSASESPGRVPRSSP